MTLHEQACDGAVVSARAQGRQQGMEDVRDEMVSLKAVVKQLELDIGIAQYCNPW